jgi:hypothetical protein
MRRLSLSLLLLPWTRAAAPERRRFAIATVLARDPDHPGIGGPHGGRDYSGLLKNWLAGLRKTGTRMEVVLLSSGYDDGELEHRFKRTDAPAFDRIVTVNSSLLHFKMRKPGDGLLGANLRFQSRMDGRMTVLKYWAWKLDYDGVLLVDADVCFIAPGGTPATTAAELYMFAAKLHDRGVYFAAYPEGKSRTYLGFNTRFSFVRPSTYAFKLLVDKAASGDFVPFTNTEQDVLETVYSPHVCNYQALGIIPPVHGHGWSFGNKTYAARDCTV